MVARPSAVTRVEPRNLEVGAETWCSTVGCANPEVLEHLLIVLWAGAFTLVVIATVMHILEARSACDRERSRTRAEREAFERFARRVSGIDASVPTRIPAGEATLVQQSATDDRLKQVRAAYRDTVMDVPHYVEEYDEPLAQNMRAEFGDDIATAVMGGSGFTPQLKDVLIERADDARRQRAELLHILDGELAALDEAEATIGRLDAALAEIESEPQAEVGFPELAGRWRRLDDLEERAREFLAARQAEIRERDAVGGRLDESIALHSYLYDSLGVSYPALADGVALVDRIRTARRRVLASLTERV